MSGVKSFLREFDTENFEKLLSQKVFNIDLSVFLVAIAIGVYTIVFSYFTMMKHYGFGTYAWDLGIFNQAFWTTLCNGKFFYSTIELMLNPSGSFFGTHFSPILFLLLPVYSVYPTVQTLLVIQSFILSLGAVPLYKLVMRVLRYRVAGLLFVFVYLLYPPLQGINWFDFHVQSFLPLFFFSAIYFVEKQSWTAYFLSIFLALMCEEHAAMVVLFIGLFIVLQYKKHLAFILKTKNFKDTVFLVSVSTVVLAALWYLMTIWVRNTFFPVNPAFFSTFKASLNWSVLGVQEPLLIPLHTILHPDKAIAALNYDFLVKIGYLLILFAPLAFRSFFKVRYILPALPWFLYSLFSNYQPYYMIFTQYPAYVIAFVFIAAVYGIGNDGTLGLKALKKRLATLFLFSLVTFMMVSPLGPVVGMLYPESGLKPVTQHEQLIHEILTYVPPNASIITHNNLFPHISSRINAYVIPTIGPIWSGKSSECKNFTDEILGKVEYTLVDIKSDPFASSVIFSLMQENHEFRALVSADGIILFKKGYTGNASMLAPHNARYNYCSLTLYSGEIIEVTNCTSRMVLHFNGSLGFSPMFWYGPRSLLPPGSYNVTLRLKINGTGEIFTVNICSNNGQNILVSKTFFGGNLTEKAIWMYQTFRLNLDKPLMDFEVRAINVSSHADIFLDYIDVKQINS